MIYTYEEGLKKYGNKYHLKKAVEMGYIYKQEKGIYSDAEYVPVLSIIAKKYPKAIFTLDSAYYYYNLTDVIPEKYYLATDRNSNKIADKRIVQIFEKNELLNMGTTTLEREGCSINIYSRERMLVELLRHKNTMPFDYYKEILLNFRSIVYELDIPTIQDYAYEVPKSAKIMEALQLEVL